MKKEERCRVILGTIKKYQTILGVTDETICKRVGISPRTYTNKKHNPELFTTGEIIAIYDFLNVPNEPVVERIF